MEKTRFELQTTLLQDQINGGTTPISATGSVRKNNFWSILFETVTLGFFLAIACGLAILPVVLFYLEDNEVDFKVINNGSTACSSAFAYSGVCEQPLTEALLTANCMLDPGGDILVLQNNESTASNLLNGLGLLNPSAACLESVRPFLCLYLFGLCDKSGVSIKPTIHQCEEIRDVVCKHEWALALDLGVPLPRCDIFPDESAVCPVVNGSVVANRDNVTETLECREGFFREDPAGICLPSCSTFLYNPKQTSIILAAVNCTAGIIAFVSALAVLVISLIRFKRILTDAEPVASLLHSLCPTVMLPDLRVTTPTFDHLCICSSYRVLLYSYSWKVADLKFQADLEFVFPSVLVVYETLDSFVLASFVIVNYVDRGLYCSSENLLKSLVEVTPFCVISGMMLTYVLLQLIVWWLFHTTILFWRVVFPFHARYFERAHGLKKIHIACVIIGLVVPLIPTITSVSLYTADYRAGSLAAAKNVSFLSGGLGFVSSSFPPILCTGSNRDAVFYSLVLPIDVIFIIGFIALVVILRIIRKQHGLFSDKSSKSPFKISTAERKLLIILVYYVLLIAVALTTFAIFIRNSEFLVEALLQHFTCEQSGHDPERPCDWSSFESRRYPFFTSLSYILLGLFPAVNLIYAINIKELKQKCCALHTKKRLTSSPP